MTKATFLERAIAYIIDVVIVGIVGGIVGGVFGFIGGMVDSDGSSGMAAIISSIGSIINLVITIGYFGYFWTTTGQTVGNMVMKIKVVKTDGSTLTWGGAILRYIGYVVNSLVCTLGWWWPLFDKDQQGWHDKIAGTYVVKA